MKTFYTSERELWREWLSEHFQTESEIWFVFPMKESGDKALSYNDAVEEALCFGWIDSTIKHIDPARRVNGLRDFEPSPFRLSSSLLVTVYVENGEKSPRFAPFI